MSDLIKVNPEMMQAFSGFIKEKYDDVVIWDGGNPTHPLYLDLWCSFVIGWQTSVNREGFKFVPVDASESMLDAGLNCWHDIDDFVVIDEIYRAMIEASQENKDE